MSRLDAVRRNVAWFRRSGIMRPADGFWGVAERIAVLADNAAAGQILRAFPSHTPLAPGVVVLEHRRADCNFQAALMFDLAAEALAEVSGQSSGGRTGSAVCGTGALARGCHSRTLPQPRAAMPHPRKTDRLLAEPDLAAIADNLLDYLLRRSALADERPDSPTLGLWGWANPLRARDFWTDDNAWVATLLLLLAKRGRPHLRDRGIACARALHRHAAAFLAHIRDRGRHTPLESPPMHGLRLNPHWLGLVAMACAHAAEADPDTDYAPFVRDYHLLVPGGPPDYDRRSIAAARDGRPWALSEYAYLSLTASVCAARFPFPEVADQARAAAELLLAHQAPDGHLRAEHYETPAGEHLADLIYTQNWATLGLYHAARVFNSAPFREGFERSAEFLTRIQDRSPDAHFNGAWRGLYDTRAGAWGGGDHYEGGQGSLYSGWTNAPIALALLLDLGGASLFASQRY